MNFVLKQKYIKEKAFLFALFLVFSFFFSTHDSLAAVGDICDSGLREESCSCSNAEGPITSITSACSKEACGNQCMIAGAKDSYSFNGEVISYSTWKDPAGPSMSVGDLLNNTIGKVFKGLIFAVFVVFGWLLAAAAALFSYVARTETVTLFLNSQSTREVWAIVRDFLNMFFILVLLFAAFCTIFQIDKWSLKKVWLNILINALLVNFSFPIARFIIDISNVIMYYFLNNMFDGLTNGGAGSMFTWFAGNSGITGILLPKETSSYPVSYLITASIFVFILAITLLVLAVMFLIRLIALTLIVMFSPVGFVGYIFPSTQKYANDWWNNLFKYAFFGPIMVFMLMVATKMMKTLGNNSSINSFVSQTKNQTIDMGQANFIESMAFFAIPIIILWIGMAVSQKMGIWGADTVVGQGQKFGKWAGKTFSGYNWGKKNLDAFSASRKKRSDEINKKRFGGRLGDRVNNLQDRAMAAIGSEKATKRLESKNIADNREEIKKEQENHDGHGTNTLVTNINTNITTPPTDKKSLITAAGQVKQAMSRGKEFEMEVEAQINSGTIKLLSGATATTAAERDQAKREYYSAARKLIQDAEKA